MALRVETFGHKHDDVAVISPPNGPTVSLSSGVGVLIGTLLTETKSDATR
jgi:hypothetical protein